MVALTRDLAARIGIITVFLAASSRLFLSLLRLQSAMSGIRGAAGTGSVTLKLVADLDAAEMSDSIRLLPEPLAAKLETSAHEGNLGFTPVAISSEVSLGFPGT